MRGEMRVVMTLLLFPVLAFSAPNGLDSKVEVVVQANGSLQLEATQAPLAQILEGIRRNTNTALNYGSLPEDLTSVSCSGTIVELMKCVLGSRRNLVIRYGEGPFDAANAARPEEIWILGSSDGEMTSPLAGNRSEGSCGASGPSNESGHSGEPELPSKQEIDRLLTQIGSRDLSTRTEAITRLAAVEINAEMLDSLHEALTDEHPTIRAQAVSTLAARKAPDTEAILRQALLDPDAAVRMMAVDSAGEDESLLLTALDDVDKNVRMLANRELEQLSNPDRGVGQ